MFNQIFHSQTKTITFAATLLFFSGLFSRVLGLVRDRLLAGELGAGLELDIYFAAFRIPDFVYGILIMGGIAAVFLPIFSEHFKKNPEKAWEFASNVLNCFLFLLVLICGILAIFAPLLAKFIVPGFSEESRELTIALTRIMFLSPIFLGISSIFSSILHYFSRFFIYSLAPILYNVGIILGIVFFLPVFGLKGLAYGVILGALMHLLIQIPAVAISGYRWKPFFNFRHSGIVKVFRLMVPRTIGAAAYHINLIVITAIASGLSAGSISVFNLSSNLHYFPVGLIGVSFALASFPALSQAWANREKEKFAHQFFLVFTQIIFFIIPVSFLMFLLRAQIVRLFYGTGKFTWIDTRLTAVCLGIFCLGIFACSLIPFLARVFYSFYNTKIPALIGIVSMFVNVFLCFFFIWILNFQNIFSDFLVRFLHLEGIENIQIIGLPLALALASIVQCFLLFIVLTQRIQGIRLRFKEIFISFTKIFLASIISAFCAYLTLYFVSDLVNMKTFLGILAQTISATMVGISVYLLLAYILRCKELKAIRTSIFKEFDKS